jgi:hypothetical protein
VSGTAAGGAPTGTVSFYICNPSQVTGAAGSEQCAGSGATGDGTLVQAVTPLTAGPGANQSQATTTTAVTANQIGVWCFRSTYVSDSPVYTGSDGNAHAECFTVTNAASATSTQSWVPNDHVVVATDAGTLSGRLTISLRSGTCSGPVVYTEPAPYDGSADVTAPITRDTVNTTAVTAANNVTPYFWRIVFTPTSSFATGFTKCETTSITINNNP